MIVANGYLLAKSHLIMLNLLQCAHIMAMAVQRLHKDAQVTIGPWIERGFYYDFDIKEPLQDKDLKMIRKEMQKIVRANLPFVREEVGGCLDSMMFLPMHAD